MTERAIAILLSAAVLTAGCWGRSPRFERPPEPYGLFAGDEVRSVEVIQDIPFQSNEAQCVEGGVNRAVEIPNHVLLVRTKKHNILMDAGVGSRYNDLYLNPAARLFLGLVPLADGAVVASVPTYTGSGMLASQVLLRGDRPRPAQIDVVIATHGHFDHIGGIVDFPNARLLIAREALQDLMAPASPRAWSATLAFREHLARLIAARRVTAFDFEPIPYAGFARSYRPFPGRDDIVLLDAPGHTPGHTAAFVTGRVGGRRRHVLFAGDAAMCAANFEGPRARPPGFAARLMTDEARAAETLGRLHKLQHGLQQVQVICSHDHQTFAGATFADRGLKLW